MILEFWVLGGSMALGSRILWSGILGLWKFWEFWYPGLLDTVVLGLWVSGVLGFWCSGFWGSEVWTSGLVPLNFFPAALSSLLPACTGVLGLLSLPR